ncbi:hypothetical protein CCOS865_01546 [Pseudomonas reidholzensis]|uniref:Secreted protein n=1 Tax=Pseudomonas reidholzensis TaxID=1785162 RepID=A0A383RQX4_9PSED|nr:hypothetical protein [Pseudomonas reidholzensis]SYX89295.1 hypothetical protein CCOS865_01546 [Pseudomonas reidholzensis]
MNFNLFPLIAASAISASVVLPAHAHADAPGKAPATHSYTEKYLQQSAHFHAALSGKHSH